MFNNQISTKFSHLFLNTSHNLHHIIAFCMYFEKQRFLNVQPYVMNQRVVSLKHMFGGTQQNTTQICECLKFLWCANSLLAHSSEVVFVRVF